MPINAQILDNPKSDRVRRIADLTRAKGRERSGLYRAATAYAPGRAIMSARVDFCRPAALYWMRT